MSGGGTRSGRRNTSTSSTTIGFYKEFEDVPIVNSFLDPGISTTQWFENNSNYKELVGKITNEEKNAINDYTKAMFMNGQLYNGFSKMSDVEKKTCRILDNFLDKSVIKSNVKVARLSTLELLFGAGNKKATLEQIRAMKGKIVYSASFLSTCAAKEGIIPLDKNVEYKIHIPAGSKGVGMYIGGPNINQFAQYQREFLVNRDINFRVGDTKWNNKRKIFETDLFFEDLLPHDYS